MNLHWKIWDQKSEERLDSCIFLTTVCSENKQETSWYIRDSVLPTEVQDVSVVENNVVEEVSQLTKA